MELSVQKIYSIGMDKYGILYAGCNSGLYKVVRGKQHYAGGQGRISCRYEPDINEVQQAAIKYAEVEPEKILSWRRQASKKAFFPKVTAGIERDTGDLWHWESGSTTRSNDDILIRGKDSIEWDISLSWDLGEIIWNDDQTSIDTRSRLMVQLRQDILDEVTRIYFERMRLKNQLDNLNIEDRKKRIDKEIKIRELTALLDALTGGYFSRAIQTDKSGSSSEG